MAPYCECAQQHFDIKIYKVKHANMLAEMQCIVAAENAEVEGEISMLARILASRPFKKLNGNRLRYLENLM